MNKVEKGYFTMILGVLWGICAVLVYFDGGMSRENVTLIMLCWTYSLLVFSEFRNVRKRHPDSIAE